MQYSPFPGPRKTGILLQREDELRQAIVQDASTHKLSKAAEGVRSAKLDVAKALEFALTQQQLKGAPVENELKTLKRDTTRWEHMFVEEIIELYRTGPKQSESDADLPGEKV